MARKKAPAKKKTGRPSAYRDEYAEQAFKLCLLGATDAKLADFFGVRESTINNWKEKHPEFLESLKAGKAEADARVAESLYNRAIGYEHPDVHISNYKGFITETPIIRKYAPDTTAAIFWLKNRDKDNWRDKQEFDHRSPDGSMTPKAITAVDPAEAARQYRDIMAGNE